MNPLAFVPKTVLVAVAAALALALLASGIYAVKTTLKLSATRVELANTKTEYAEAGRRQALAYAALGDTYRRAEQSWQGQKQEIVNASRKQIAGVLADAAAAADSGQLLRARLAELTACPGRSTEAAGTGAGGETAPATAGLLADVQRRLDEAANRIAQFADESRVAGQACERSFDAVTDTLKGASP